MTRQTDLIVSLRASVYPGEDDQSILMAINYCNSRKLDPFKKPVHIINSLTFDPSSGTDVYKKTLLPGIAEIRTTACNTGKYAGIDEPKFGPCVEFEGLMAPAFCTITVYKIVEGVSCKFSHTEYFKEICATNKDGKPNLMWLKRPRGQLQKCTEAGALRKAFPAELGGINTYEEVYGRQPHSDKPAKGKPIVKLPKAKPVKKGKL